jgi:hypothetical protein
MEGDVAASYEYYLDHAVKIAIYGTWPERNSEKPRHPKKDVKIALLCTCFL